MIKSASVWRTVSYTHLIQRSNVSLRLFERCEKRKQGFDYHRTGNKEAAGNAVGARDLPVHGGDHLGGEAAAVGIGFLGKVGEVAQADAITKMCIRDR